ncbi:MAG: hypothetical protein RIE73_08565 [Coleofasciculus sp. C1-SOL-03]|uniref:hypothetical protein n=1 Tax=Coleofasciculus sp. C1-SOL-03 TaxID=3069522 RepID=UPI0032FC9F6B
MRTFAITLSQRIEARATGFERMKWARSHSDAVVFKRMGMQVDEAIEITAILTLHPPL